MQQRIRRSSLGSTSSLTRRSSISAKDVLALQQTLQKQQKVSTQVVAVLLVVLPVFTFVYFYSISLHFGVFLTTTRSLLLRWPFGVQCIPPLLDVTAWKVTTVVFALQLIFYWVLPHDAVVVVSSSLGDQTKWVNGFFSCVLLNLLFVLGVSTGLYKGDVVFAHFNSIILSLAVISVLILVFLVVSYHIGTGNSTHPTVLDVDVKHFIRSRITFGFWPLFVISAVFHHLSTHGQISKSLLCCSFVQLVYVLRFHWNEDLYLNSLDSKRSNVGFYRLWSDLVFYPVVYASPIVVLAQTSKSLSLLSNIIFTIAALAGIVLTTRIDRQKYEFRKAKGLMKVSGTDAFFITAKCKTESGDLTANLLLGSGYWGVSRHPNYMCEAFTFAAFSAFQGYPSLLAHFPALFVAGFLLARALSDEWRCGVKYGQYWQQYCTKVKYRLIPGVY